MDYQKTNYTESDIRDYLSKNLHLIDKQLSLIKNEFHLPNQDDSSSSCNKIH